MSQKSADAFRTISEVAEWLGTPAHVLRFWESKFSQVKPVKRAGGRRYYRPNDMQLLGGIKKLLHEDGLTIKGAQKLLRENGIRYVAALSQPLDDDLEQFVNTPMQPDVPPPPRERAAPTPITEPENTVLAFAPKVSPDRSVSLDDEDPATDDAAASAAAEPQSPEAVDAMDVGAPTADRLDAEDADGTDVAPPELDIPDPEPAALEPDPVSEIAVSEDLVSDAPVTDAPVAETPVAEAPADPPVGFFSRNRTGARFSFSAPAEPETPATDAMSDGDDPGLFGDVFDDTPEPEDLPEPTPVDAAMAAPDPEPVEGEPAAPEPVVPEPVMPGPQVAQVSVPADPRDEDVSAPPGLLTKLSERPDLSAQAAQLTFFLDRLTALRDKISASDAA